MRLLKCPLHHYELIERHIADHGRVRDVVPKSVVIDLRAEARVLGGGLREGSASARRRASTLTGLPADRESSSRKSLSEMTSVSCPASRSSCAFRCLPLSVMPGTNRVGSAVPTTRMSVLRLTPAVACAPTVASRCWASVRDREFSVPVMQMWRPYRGPSGSASGFAVGMGGRFSSTRRRQFDHDPPRQRLLEHRGGRLSWVRRLPRLRTEGDRRAAATFGGRRPGSRRTGPPAISPPSPCRLRVMPLCRKQRCGRPAGGRRRSRGSAAEHLSGDNGCHADRTDAARPVVGSLEVD